MIREANGASRVTVGSARRQDAFDHYLE